VWYVLLTFSAEEDAPGRTAEVDAWLAGRGLPGLTRVEARALPDDGVLLAGGGVPEFPVGAFLAMLGGIAWRRPERVQLLVREPGDDRWAVVAGA
jgi:hypothetical protein